MLLSLGQALRQWQSSGLRTEWCKKGQSDAALSLEQENSQRQCPASTSVASSEAQQVFDRVLCCRPLFRLISLVLRCVARSVVC